MELQLVEREEKSLKVEVVNPDDTVIYPLISRLLRDERVEDARYITGHPHLDRPTILVRVHKDKPEAVLRDAARALAAEYGEMREQVQTALGSAS